MARFMIKMFLGVLMFGFRATTKQTSPFPQAPNNIKMAKATIRIICVFVSKWLPGLSKDEARNSSS